MAQVVAVHSQTKEIGGNEAELRGANSDDADDGAVGAGDNPTLPFMSADQIRREQRKSARDVIKAKQLIEPINDSPSSCASLVTK